MSKEYIFMSSEYSSMGRWIAVIVSKELGIDYYDGDALLGLIDDAPWLDVKSLWKFDAMLAESTLTNEQLRNDELFIKVHEVMSKAILKAVEKGPCIIHERCASEILKGKVDFLKVHIYATDIDNKIPRAKLDPAYDFKNLTKEDIIKIINHEDRKRIVYHEALSNHWWGEKESYDLCLNSEVLGKEKCAKIIVASM